MPGSRRPGGRRPLFHGWSLDPFPRRIDSRNTVIQYDCHSKYAHQDRDFGKQEEMPSASSSGIGTAQDETPAIGLQSVLPACIALMTPTVAHAADTWRHGVVEAKGDGQADGRPPRGDKYGLEIPKSTTPAMSRTAALTFG
jgi:hypothetical protein